MTNDEKGQWVLYGGLILVMLSCSAFMFALAYRIVWGG